MRVHDAVGGERVATDAREHLLGGRLAVAARHREDARADPTPMQSRQVPERHQRVPNQDDATGGLGAVRRAIHDDRARTPILRLGHECVAVVTVPAQRDEELARADRTAVGRDAGERRRLSERGELAAGRGQNLLERERAHERSANAWRTSSRSSRWRFSLPMIW